MNREEAIAELNILHERLSNPKNCEDGCYSWEDGWYVEAIDMAIKALKAQEWIPCSERLPSDSGNYLITVADLRLGHIGEHTVTMADFYAKEKKWNSAVDVYAWMPLPQPYREVGEEE